MAKQYTVLCVDDDSSILASLVRSLITTAYRVLTAMSGAKGLEILEKEKVDLIIVDQRMPEMSGSEFLKEVRQKHPHIVSIMLSGYCDFDNLVSAINEGEIFRYIPKPWDSKKLLEVIEAALYQKEVINIVEDLSKGLKKISQDPDNISFEAMEEQDSLCIRIHDESKVVSQESIARYLDFISDFLGVDKGEKIKMLSGAITKRKERIIMSVDIGKGVALKIELPPITASKN